MSGIFAAGLGVVSPAGWGLEPFRQALQKGEGIAVRELNRPGWPHTLSTRSVPSPSPRPNFLSQPRLRRTSLISQYAVAAALEALGTDAERIQSGALRLGIILTVMAGCVNYSRRFYDETLKDPATASPLVFPETVFNAPASHLGALLSAKTNNYTLVGDPGTFLAGLAVAADWLLNDTVDGCVVIGTEELDWLTADAFHLFSKEVIVSDGAGAIYLRRTPPEEASLVELSSITDAFSFTEKQPPSIAARAMRSQLPAFHPKTILCDGVRSIPHLDAPEQCAWEDWRGFRLSPKTILGEGLAAGPAWQCAAAVDALQRNLYASAIVSVVGCNQQAIGAHFCNRTPPVT